MAFARVAVPAPFEAFDRLLDYKVPTELEETLKPGSLVEVPLGRRSTWGLCMALSESARFDVSKIKPVLKVKLPVPLFCQTRLNFLSWISRHYFYPIGEVIETAIPNGVRDGTDRTLKLSTALPPPLNILQPKHQLNSEQSAAVDLITRQQSGPVVLWGVTGSGKTEVYLEAIARVLDQGKTALVLVPEISLTPQLTSRFEERFPQQLAIFHSAQKKAQLRGHWLDVLMGHRRIALGARSALFAPLSDLGLIVVDEEHDPSYKQEERLKYQARDCALALGALFKSSVVLGSATPSAETFHSARSGKAALAKLSARAAQGSRMPELTMIDLKKQMGLENKDPSELAMAAPHNASTLSSSLGAATRGDFFLSPELSLALDEVLAKKEQAILFLNRRGLASAEFCRSCGHSMDCSNCDVKLTPHFEKLLCHYCGFSCVVPKLCPKCSKPDSFVKVGVGTEAIEESLKTHFPQCRTLRLDRDVVTHPDELEAILAQFRNREADVLVGTQMVAKGHDFPSVSLVGIVLADLGLCVPDFRSHERALQLLLQVSGRAGRAAIAGRVLLQAFDPSHPVFEALIQQRSLDDYGAFLDREIALRKPFGYPPFGRLVLLRFSGLSAPQVRAAAETVCRGLKRATNEITVLGPVASPIGKIKNNYRFQALIKAPAMAPLQKAITWIWAGWVREKLEQKYRTRFVIDVDPMQML